MSQLQTPLYLAGKERVTSFAEADEILRNSAFAAGGTEQESLPFRGDTLLELDGNAHRQRRKLETPLFTKAMLEHYEHRILAPTIQRCLADAARARGPDGVVRADLVQLSSRMFLQIAAAVIGLDEVDTSERTELLEQCMYALNAAFDVKYSTRDHAEVIAEGLVAKQRFIEHFYRPSVERHAALLARHARGEISDHELPLDLLTIMLRHHGADWDSDLPIRECILYLAGATETTSNAVNHAIVELHKWLIAHPEDRAQLDNEAFLRGVCNEALRLKLNVTALVRRATTDFTLGSGRRIEAGKFVAVDLIDANRDPGVFGADAMSFNPRREVPPGVRPYGLAFSTGRHQCIGLPLVTTLSGAPAAEGESQRALAKILRALLAAGIKLDPENLPQYRPTAEEVFATLPVIFEAL